jgi:hypothetical protein
MIGAVMKFHRMFSFCLGASLALLVGQPIFAISSSIQMPEKVGANGDDFAPKGWRVFKSATGDLTFQNLGTTTMNTLPPG